MKKQIITATFLLTAAMFMVSCGSKTSENKTENTITVQSENAKYQCPLNARAKKCMTSQGNALSAIWICKKLKEHTTITSMTQPTQIIRKKRAEQ